MIEGRYLEVNGANIYLYDSSNKREYKYKDTLIFLHGSPGQISNWKYQIEYFEDYYRVVAYDQRGYGKSDKPTEVELNDYLNDLNKIIKILDLDPDHLFLIGHSFGGIVAQEFASRNKVGGLVLIGSIAKIKPDTIDKIIWRLPPIFWRRILFTENPITRRLYRKIFFSQKTNDAVYMEFLRDNKEYIESLPPHVFRYSKCYSKYDASNTVVNISAPTLIIVGEDDKVTPIYQSKLLNQLIPDSRLVIVKEAGHLILYEKPNEINQLIHEFIKKSST